MFSSYKRVISGVVVVAAAVVVVPMAVSPPKASANATIVGTAQVIDAREEILSVQSPAMGRVVRLDVLLPADTAPHPVLYLLDGNGATNSQTRSTWTLRTDAKQFFASIPVTVVMPIGGGGTFYTDWLADDPTLGHSRWETFLTQELPPLINGTLHGNGINGVAGLSMGGQAAATLAFRNPSLYRSVGIYSGCLFSDTIADVGQVTVRAAVRSAGGNPDNMWGNATNPQWDYHDPSATDHLKALKGKSVYMYAGSGVPGPLDANFDPTLSYPVTLTEAAALETVAHTCTVAVTLQMNLLGIAVTSNDLKLVGTHSWPYWQYALHDSWPTLRKGLGV